MKVINVLLIIIFILFVILGIKIYHSNSSEHEYSVQDIQKILDKAKDIKNYECTIGDVQYKRKDYKIYTKSNENNIVAITDYLYDEQISYDIDTIEEMGYIKMEPQIKEIYSSNSWIINDGDISHYDNLEILVAKEEKNENTQYLKVEFKTTTQMPLWLDDNETVISANITIWIDINNGLIMKIKNAVGEVHEFNYEFNTVTDEDVNPDLTGYKKIETND